MRTHVLAALIPALLASVAAGGDQPGLVRHEPLPQADPASGLRGARADTPILVFDEGDGLTELPASIRVGDRTIVAPPKSVTTTGEDLLYRTAERGKAPAPGTLQNLDGAYKPDRETEREPWLTYHAVFDPDPIPFKRNQAKDLIREDGTLVVEAPSVRSFNVTGNLVSAGREVFYGSVLLEAKAGIPVPLPSISPESRILSYETVPSAELEFGKDGADNYYVTAAASFTRLRLNFVMDAPAHWFDGQPGSEITLDDVPDELRPDVPESFRPAIHRVFDAIGVTDSDSFSAALAKMVYWFRDFKTGVLPHRSQDLYLDLALGKKGVCRHRAYAFTITAQGFGIPTRYVTNEAHTFAEVYVPHSGWLRVDLGGGAAGMNVRNGAEKNRHTVDPKDDAFGFPPGFRGGYSQQASSRGADSDGDSQDDVKGLPPEAERPLSPAEEAFEASPGARPLARRKPIAMPYRAPKGDRRDETEVILEGAEARVFRGDTLTLRGHVLTKVIGQAVVGGTVRISLLDPARKQVLYILGTASTGEAGEFVISAPIPADADLGAWELVAEFAGNDAYAPAMSPP